MESRKNHDGIAPIDDRGATAIAVSPAITVGLSGVGTFPEATESSQIRSEVAQGAAADRRQRGQRRCHRPRFSSNDAQAEGVALSLSAGFGVGVTVA